MALKAAIDIGNHTTKIIEYKPIKKGISIQEVHRLEGLRDDNLEYLIEEIQDSVKAKDLSIMMSKINTSHIKVEEKNPNRFLKDRIKALKKDGYNSDFIKLNDRQYLFSYVQKNLVDSIVRPLFKKKKVRAVDANSSALTYLSKLYNDYETEILLDIGHLSTEVLIKHRDKIIKYDKLNIGMYQIIEDIKNTIGLPYTRTLELMLQLGLDKDNLPINTSEILGNTHITEFEYGSTVHDHIEYYLSRVANLLKADQPFKADDSKLVLIGGGPLMRGLENIVKNNLEIEVETFSLVSSITGDVSIINDSNKKIDSVYAPVIGLGLREVLK